MFLAYVGKVQLDGTIHVDRAAFWKNEVDADELKMRKRDEPVITPADPSHNNPALLTLHDGRPMPLVEDDALQKRVNEIGLRLVPEYQKNLPVSDPTKIDFRFYVVRSKSRIVLDALNGVVLVPDTLLKNLQNEAQAAALLAVAVAQVIEKQEYQSKHRRHLQQASTWLLAGVSAIPSPLALVALPAQIANGKSYRTYLTDMAEQAARVGLGYMLTAGYDPREAPVAWKLTLQKHPEKNDELPEFGKYVNTELETQYWKTDFSGLRVGSDEYREMVKGLE
jgi:predicted Zn-dependent protease